MRQMSVLALLWAMVASATLALACDPQRCSHAAHLPDDVDVFVELNDATRDDWAFVSSLLGPSGSVNESWHELADVLEFEEDEAFNRLLGARVSIAVRGVWTGETQWAALFTTNAKTAAMLRAQLGARPRKIVGGQSVLRLPGGRFQVTEFQHDQRVTVMMAPADERAGLFYNACDPGPGTLAQADRVLAFDGFDESVSHFVTLTLPESDGWITAGAEIDGPIVDLALRGQLDNMAPPRPMINPAGWERLFESAIFTVVERGGTLFDEKSGWPFEAIGPLSEAMGKSAGDVVVGVVRENVEGSLEFAGAISTAGPEARAKLLDDGASRSIALLSGTGELAHDFEGIAPRALRTAGVSDSLNIHWRYAGGGWQPGWVIGATSIELVDELMEVAVPEADQMRVRVTLDGEGWEAMPMAAWRSIGVARPGRLLSLIKAKNQTLPGVLGRLSEIELIRWAVRDLPAGGIDGSLTVIRAQ